MNEAKSMQFLQIAMKYVPEAKEMLAKQGIELDINTVEPFLKILTQVMEEAYELGKNDAVKE